MFEDSTAVGLQPTTQQPDGCWSKSAVCLQEKASRRMSCCHAVNGEAGKWQDVGNCLHCGRVPARQYILLCSGGTSVLTELDLCWPDLIS